MRKELVDEVTQDKISITRYMDGARNTTIYISGDIKNEIDSTFPIIELAEMSGQPKSLRLDNLCYLLEGNLRAILTYRDEPYFIPMSGKGKLELDKLGGIPGHDLDITFKGMGTFFIGLDISKLGV